MPRVPPTSEPAVSTISGAVTDPLLDSCEESEAPSSKPKSVLRRACSCRCTPVVSGLFVAGVLSAFAGAVVTVHTVANPGSRTGWVPPPPGPPPPCGVWPYDNPCGSCVYGVQTTHRVAAKETCSTIARKYNVPQFDLFNRNTSTHCCEVTCNVGPAGDQGDCALDSGATVRATDLIDICNPPTIEQWKHAGHPQLPPEKVVGTFIGATPSGIRAPLRLPDSVNVGMLFETSDQPSRHAGIFTVGNQFTDDSPTVCSAQVNPLQEYRGESADSAEGKRIWLFSWATNSGQWSSSHNDAWEEAAANSLVDIILRYRLDGIDVNIEWRPNNFAQHMCQTFRLLHEKLGPDLIITVTPYTQTASEYAQLASTCGEEVTWANWEGYIHRSDDYSEFRAIASHFGWEKSVFGISTQSGSPSLTRVPQILAQAEQESNGAGPRGVFFWTAEWSTRWTPDWCFEDRMSAALNHEDPVIPPGTETCRHK